MEELSELEQMISRIITTQEDILSVLHKIEEDIKTLKENK